MSSSVVDCLLGAAPLRSFVGGLLYSVHSPSKLHGWLHTGASSMADCSHCSLRWLIHHIFVNNPKECRQKTGYGHSIALMSYGTGMTETLTFDVLNYAVLEKMWEWHSCTLTKTYVNWHYILWITHKQIATTAPLTGNTYKTKIALTINN